MRSSSPFFLDPNFSFADDWYEIQSDESVDLSWSGSDACEFATISIQVEETDVAGTIYDEDATSGDVTHTIPATTFEECKLYTLTAVVTNSKPNPAEEVSTESTPIMPKTPGKTKYIINQ